MSAPGNAEAIAAKKKLIAEKLQQIKENHPTTWDDQAGCSSIAEPSSSESKDAKKDNKSEEARLKKQAADAELKAKIVEQTKALDELNKKLDSLAKTEDKVNFHLQRARIHQKLLSLNYELKFLNAAMLADENATQDYLDVLDLDPENITIRLEFMHFRFYSRNYEKAVEIGDASTVTNAALKCFQGLNLELATRSDLQTFIATGRVPLSEVVYNQKRTLQFLQEAAEDKSTNENTKANYQKVLELVVQLRQFDVHNVPYDFQNTETYLQGLASGLYYNPYTIFQNRIAEFCFYLAIEHIKQKNFEMAINNYIDGMHFGVNLTNKDQQAWQTAYFNNLPGNLHEEHQFRIFSAFVAREKTPNNGSSNSSSSSSSSGSGQSQKSESKVESPQPGDKRKRDQEPLSSSDSSSVAVQQDTAMRDVEEPVSSSSSGNNMAPTDDSNDTKADSPNAKRQRVTGSYSASVAVLTDPGGIQPFVAAATNSSQVSSASSASLNTSALSSESQAVVAAIVQAATTPTVSDSGTSAMDTSDETTPRQVL